MPSFKSDVNVESSKALTAKIDFENNLEEEQAEAEKETTEDDSSDTDEKEKEKYPADSNSFMAIHRWSQSKVFLFFFDGLYLPGHLFMLPILSVMYKNGTNILWMEIPTRKQND